MKCDGCGREQLLVEGHGYEGLDMCGQCVAYVGMLKGTGAQESVLAAYRTRKANYAAGLGAR